MSEVPLQLANPFISGTTGQNMLEGDPQEICEFPKDERSHTPRTANTLAVQGYLCS